jgi:hypothetical protein
MVRQTPLFAARSAAIAGLVVCGMVAFQLICLLVRCQWDLCGDEAYYWDWSRHFDLGYSTKGPMVAWLIALSVKLTGPLAVWLTGSTMPAVRLPAILLGGLTAWGVYRLGTLTCRNPRVGLWAALVLPAVPLFATGGFVMTDDAPFVCFWTWAAVFAFRAIEQDSTRAWLYAGAMACLGVLSKYTMLAFPAGVGICLAATPRGRRQFARPGSWAMALLCALGLAPIVIWNLQHNWVGMGHLAGRIGLSRSGSTGAAAVLKFLGAEVAVLGAVWWFVGAYSLWAAGRLLLRNLRGRAAVGEGSVDDASAGFGLWYLISLWAIVWIACLAASVRGVTQPNWPAPAYVPLLVLIGWTFERTLHSSSPAQRRAIWWNYGVCWTLLVVAMGLMRHSEWFYPLVADRLPEPTAKQPSPIRRFDPTCRMRGYRDLAPEIERRVAQLRREGLDPFVLTPEYGIASSLSFYMKGQPEVYCIGGAAAFRVAVGNQHDVWRPNPRLDPEMFIGRPAVIVEPTYLPIMFGPWTADLGLFAQASATERIMIARGKVAIASWYVTVCRDYRGLATLDPMWKALDPLVTPEFYKAQGGTDLAYIRALFHLLLHRAPIPTEETAWLDDIHRSNAAIMAVHLWTSPEARAIRDHEELVNRVRALARSESENQPASRR